MQDASTLPGSGQLIHCLLAMQCFASGYQADGRSEPAPRFHTVFPFLLIRLACGPEGRGKGGRGEAGGGFSHLICHSERLLRCRCQVKRRLLVAIIFLPYILAGHLSALRLLRRPRALLMTLVSGIYLHHTSLPLSAVYLTSCRPVCLCFLVCLFPLRLDLFFPPNPFHSPHWHSTTLLWEHDKKTCPLPR